MTKELLRDNEEKEELENTEEYNQLITSLAELMIYFNNFEFPEIGRWSMRDIRKRFKRIKKQKISHEDEYLNITNSIQIFIYIFSGILKDEIINVFDKIFPYISTKIILNSDEKEDLKLMIKSHAIIYKLKNKGIYIKKGKCGKRICKEDINEDINRQAELNSFLDSFFYASFADPKEPLLLFGPSGYKSFLASKITHGRKSINLYSETSLSQLLGTTCIRKTLNAKKYYLKEILSICKISKEDKKYKDLEDSLEKYIEEQIQKTKTSNIMRNHINTSRKKFIQQIENEINGKKNEFVEPILKKLKENLTLFNEDNDKNIIYNFTSYFQAGIITQNIFEQKYIILKGIDSLSPNVLERFNDLFNYYPRFLLNEDLYNTFTGEIKEISNFSAEFRIIGISTIENINNLSEASKSRFTIISTSDYNSDEKKILITKINDLIPSSFISFLKEFKNEFSDNDKTFEISFKIIFKILMIYEKLSKANKQPNEKKFALSIYFAFQPFLNEQEIEILIKILKKLFIK